MQGSSNNSFIPKRRNSTRQRSKPARKIFLITIIAYSLLFAALLAAGGTVFYKSYTVDQLQNEVVLLDKAVNTFSVQDFKRVQEFDAILTKAQQRVDNTVSVVAILDELDRVTAQPIQINNFEMQRIGDQDMLVAINFSTETLDAALFQRKILTTTSALLTSIEISEVTVQSAVEAAAPGELDTAAAVTFLAEFSIPVAAALYDPAEARRPEIGKFQSAESANNPTNRAFENNDFSESELEQDDSLSDDIQLLEEVDANEITI